MYIEVKPVKKIDKIYVNPKYLSKDESDNPDLLQSLLQFEIPDLEEKPESIDIHFKREIAHSIQIRALLKRKRHDEFIITYVYEMEGKFYIFLCDSVASEIDEALFSKYHEIAEQLSKENYVDNPNQNNYIQIIFAREILNAIYERFNFPLFIKCQMNDCFYNMDIDAILKIINSK